MKLNIDIKNKKGNLDVNAEKIIEKGMDYKEKDWKDKFNTRHNAKKEIMELKHKQSIEKKEQHLKKKTLVQEIFDGINTNKMLQLEKKREIEEIKRQEEERKLEEERKREEERIRKEQEETFRKQNERKCIGYFSFFIGLILAIIGFGFGTDGSGLQMLGSFGVCGCIAGFILLLKNDKNIK